MIFLSKLEKLREARLGREGRCPGLPAPHPPRGPPSAGLHGRPPEGGQGKLRLRAGPRLQAADRQLRGAATGATSPHARYLRGHQGLHLEGW